MATKALAQDDVDKLFSVVERLAPNCPEEPYLAHGDFGFDNVLINDGRVSAVLDWSGARYGDFLYDVSWLIFWSPAYDVRGYFHRRYSAGRIDVTRFDERIDCYLAFIGLHGIAFFAKQAPDRQQEYRWARERARTLLGI